MFKLANKISQSKVIYAQINKYCKTKLEGLGHYQKLSRATKNRDFGCFCMQFQFGTSEAQYNTSWIFIGQIILILSYIGFNMGFCISYGSSCDQSTYMPDYFAKQESQLSSLLLQSQQSVWLQAFLHSFISFLLFSPSLPHNSLS